MNPFQEIDNSLNQIFSSFSSLVAELNFEKICEVSLPCDPKVLDQYAQLDAKGVYFFEIKTEGSKFDDFDAWSADFIRKWTDARFEKRFVSNPKKKRLKAHSTLKPWVPLYIGKSKKIKQRLLEHIGLDLDSETFAMKLNLRDEFEGARLRISIAQLDVKNYDIIAPRLEKAMRERFNPIVGQ